MTAYPSRETMPGSSGIAPSAVSSVRAVPPRSPPVEPYRQTEWYDVTPPPTVRLRPLVVNGPLS
ncbi:hypothetical protein GALL_291640 [mine drainage metagenome]|uniref:Uncharacterized protein n=1 Tax=mine drainage metagenome TaxID=410659 RepID=A0A1J5RLA3_9ZZZZ